MGANKTQQYEQEKCISACRVHNVVIGLSKNLNNSLHKDFLGVVGLEFFLIMKFIMLMQYFIYQQSTKKSYLVVCFRVPLF